MPRLGNNLVSAVVSSVVRVRERATLCRPDISNFVMRGARKAGLSQPALVLAEMVNQAQSHGIGIFIGFHGDDPKGVVVGHLPSSAFHIAPMITLLYSEGAGRALSVEMGRRLRQWLVLSGFNYVVTSNLWHDDSAFMRHFAHFGTPERIGSTLRFSF